MIVVRRVGTNLLVEEGIFMTFTTVFLSLVRHRTKRTLLRRYPDSCISRLKTLLASVPELEVH